MEEFIFCLTKLKKRYKTKHVQSTKHKHFFPNLIINIYLVKKMKLVNLKISFSHSVMSIKRNLLNLLYVIFGRKMVWL